MADLPSGRVTFLFTDIEGSTRLVQEIGAEGYDELLTLHSQVLRDAVRVHDGVEFGTEGDAHFFAFADPAEALRAAIDGQRALGAAEFPTGSEIRVRMGVHTGTPQRRAGGYVGVDVNRVARITAAGHGGQVLTSESTEALVGGSDASARFVDLGQHRLKDLVEPEHIFQVAAPDLPDEFPPIRTIDTRPKALPAQVASFIGRGHELAEVQELLEQHRLVTLTGPGGSGKTRLAIAAADRVLPAFDDGVFFISLAPLRDPEMVALTTATVIGVREVPDRPISATLADHLRSRRLLLAFDNFEHLLPAAPLVSQVLAEAPGVRVLATSRILLHLYGEREFAVPPLPLPPDGGSVAELAANPAVALFLDRAAAVSPGFHLTAENASTIGEICRRVDGLPLAIELAAARTRILSPSELAKRLEHRLAALVGGAPDVADRQRTLRGTIEWSHELLDPSQRTLFAQLSIFDGGWTLDAAESVAGEGLEADVAEVLGSLVDQSLVRREPAEETPRFAMLETIREFAAEQLAAGGDRSTIAARHATYFMDLSEAAEPHLTGELVAEWSNRLTRENDNLRSALRWSLATEEPGHLEIGLRLAAAAWRFWQRVGSLSEGREWLDALLARVADQPHSASKARALIALGGIAYWQTDYDGTAEAYEEAERVAEGIGDRRLMAEALDALSYVPMLRGEFDRAREISARARELYLEVGDRFRAALMAANAAYLGIYTGEYADAVPPMLDAVEEARRAGDRYWLINGLTGLGQLHRMMGTIEEARRYYAEALRLSLEDGNLAMLTMALDPLANLEGGAGEHERAVRLWAASDAIKERIGGGAPEEGMLVSDPRAVAAAAIGQEAVDAAWREGRRMSPAEAVREAATLAGVDSASNLAPVSD